MIVVSDTSSISNLLMIGEIEILRRTFKEVLIPPAVYDELGRIEKHRLFLEDSDWIMRVELSDPTLFNQIRQTLDLGESEAIALAVEVKADFLLIDEADGRAVAESLGINITGLFGVLIVAKEQGYISAVRPYIEKLTEQARFRASGRIVDTVLELAGER